MVSPFLREVETRPHYTAPFNSLVAQGVLKFSETFPWPPKLSHQLPRGFDLCLPYYSSFQTLIFIFAY